MSALKVVDPSTGEITTEAATLGGNVPPGIVKKLAIVQAELGSVEKKGHNRNQNYDFVRESDLVEKLRPLLVKTGLFLNQRVVRVDCVQHSISTSGSQMWRTEVEIEFTWVDTQTGATWVAGVFPGHGADPGDKGVYKALTGAKKYFIMNTFLVTTGDDPEADERVDRETAAQGHGPTVVGRPRSEGQGRGGRSNVPTAAQMAELKRLLGAAGYVKTPEILGFIEKTLNLSTRHVDATKTGALLNFLQSLTGQQVGILIRTLVETETAGEEPQTNDDTDAEDAAKDKVDTGEYDPSDAGDV